MWAAGYALGKAGYAASGFRLRAAGAHGRYDYEGSPLLDGNPTTFDGQDAFAAALIGYEFRPGRLVVKLFTDIEGEDQHIVPHDPTIQCKAARSDCGCKPKAGSICRREASSPPTQAMAPPSRNIGRWCGSGYRLTPRFSRGLEGGALGNEEYDAGRGGGFARVSARWRSRSLAVSPAIIWKTSRRICGARALSAVLKIPRFATADESALPAPLRQCLASSSASLVCRKPARQGGIARPLWCASCVRGMSFGMYPTELLQRKA